MDGSNSLCVVRRALCAFIAVLAVFAAVSVHAADGKKALSGLNLEEFSSSSGNVMWSNNPFVKPAYDVAMDEIKLTGIVYNEDDQAILINDMVMRKGDKIGSSEVVEIEPDRVILRNEDGVFSVSLRGGVQ